MTDHGRHRAAGWAAVGALGLALAAAAYWLLFTAFMLYDDEGYVLVSLQNFSAHGSLYDQVYTQYGPFPYLLLDGVHRLLRFEFTNTSGRWITAFTWLGACGLSAAVVFRATRSLNWTAFTLAGVFAYLWIMINEPVHPGGLVALLLAWAAVSGARSAEADDPGRFALMAAFAGAALTLTKINVGAFFVAAAGLWLALHTANERSRRTLLWCGAVACALLPYALMRSLFAATWVREYGLIFICSSLALLLTAEPVARRVASLRNWGVFVVGGAALGGLMVALTLLRGTTLPRFVEGVFLEPLRHPGVYFFAMQWRSGAAVVAVASLAAAVAVARMRGQNAERARSFVAWGRVVAAALFLGTPLQLVPVTMAGWGMSYGVSLAWLFVVPVSADRRGTATRLWVALLLVLQFLHGYPIAGSQMNWGTFLWVPLLALGMHDAAPTVRAGLGRMARWVMPASAAALAGVTLFIAGRFVSLGWERYFNSVPLRLHGAENLRMPDELTHAMRIMEENLAAHGDMLFSVPGLYSANLWTGLPTPTLANVTHWFTLLTEAQQQAIIERFAAAERPVLLVQRPLVDYLVNGGFARSGPLVRWIRQQFEPAFAVYPYELWVRRGRTIAPLGTATVSPADDGAAHLALTVGRTRGGVARIDIFDIAHPASRIASIDLRETPGTVTPLTLAGELAAPEAPHRANDAIAGPARLSVPLSPATAALISTRTLFVLRDDNSQPVGELRCIGIPAPAQGGPPPAR